ncbi:site-specific integrase [Williamsia sp.]|uniref:tyrosine-type recombinase/integrase n=1 Tax=Williamsia sp. TaxID=1872085 RepID=UPI001A1AED30|nr:site-specific integrase [Williamsia sp.]MBJ7289404.1 site-specific integrase [Williamsia sp.]
MTVQNGGERPTVKRGVRSGVVDRWHSRKDLDGGEKCCGTTKAPTSRHKKGLRWQARFVDADGRDVGKGFERKHDAKIWLDEQMASVTRRDYVHSDRSSMTVAEMGEKWVASSSSLKPSTRAGYLNRWSTHVEPYWGSMRLSDVEHGDIVTWVSGLANADGSPMSVSSKHACWGVLNKVLAMALADRRLSVNPAAGVKLPKKGSSSHDLTVLDAPQLLALARAATGESETGSEAETVILTLGMVGLRFGEMTGLRVGDVDLSRKTMRIQRNVVEVGGNLVIGSPKSGEERTVSYPPVLADRLVALCRDRGAEEYVFQLGGRDAKGPSRPLRRTNWNRRVFYPAAIAAGHVDSEGKATISPHDLRHCAAATMVRAGASVHVVQRQLGHSKPSITLDVYSNLFAEDLGAAAASLSKVYEDLARADDDDDGVVVQMAR